LESEIKMQTSKDKEEVKGPEIEQEIYNLD